MRQLKIQYQITVREGPALEKYLQEIAQHSPLSPEREVELAKRIKEGDDAALEELCVCNLRFVVSVAKQYQNQGLSLSDLINEGNMGLMKAARRFDETRGFKFISYAVWWIRQSIMQALVENSRIIRLPLNKVDSYQKINKVLSDFLQHHQREPSIREIEEITGMREKDVRELLKLNARPISMDAPLGDDDDNNPIINVLEGNEDDHPDMQLNKDSLKEEVYHILSLLHTREAEILCCYYGLGEERPLSLEEIGEKFDLTRERVRQIKERAIRRLRKVSVSKELKHFL